MWADRRPEAGSERPTIASGGFNVLSVQHLFRTVEVHHGVDFISVILAKEDRFEGKRAGIGICFQQMGRIRRTACQHSTIFAI